MNWVVHMQSILQGNRAASLLVPIVHVSQPNIKQISIHSRRRRISKPRISCRVDASSKGDEVLRTLSENGEVAIIVVDGTNLVREVSKVPNYRVLISEYHLDGFFS